LNLYIESGLASFGNGDVFEVWQVLTLEGEEVVTLRKQAEARAARDFLERSQVSTVAQARELLDTHGFRGVQ
jgi:hypothetical protein